MISTSNGSGVDIPVARAFAPFTQPKPYKGLSGGRSSGKSHFFVDNLLDESLRMHIRAACIRETQNSLQESVKQLIEDKIEDYGLDDQFRITNTEIIGPNDSLFVFKGIQSHTATRIKSLEGFNRAYIEEAQALSKKSLTTLVPTIRGDDSELWAAWNPENPTDPIDEFFHGALKEKDPDFLYRHVTFRDNPWLPDRSKANMLRDRRRDPELYRHVWLGDYLKLSNARVFRNWREEAFETPADVVFYYGADWGYSIDPTVLVRCFLVGRTLYVDQEVHKTRVPIDHVPFMFAGMDDREIRRKSPLVFSQLVRDGIAYPGIPGCREWPITADSARPETIAYMQKHGFPRMRPSIKGAGSLQEGVEFLQSYDIVVHPRCRHTIDELTFYSYKTDPKTEEVIPVLADKKNHVIDALRYAIERLRRAGKSAGTW